MAEQAKGQILALAMSAIGPPPVRPPPCNNSLGSLMEAQKMLLNDPKYSDLVVRCKDKEWKCQRAILCQRCDFFRAACEKSWLESETRVIDLSDDEPEGVEILRRYLYTLQIPSPYCRNDFIRMYLLGDKYDVPSLREFGKDRLFFAIRKELSVWSTEPEPQRGAWFNFIVTVWRWGTPDAQGFRDEVVAATVSSCMALVKETRFQNILSNLTEFRVAWITAMAEKVTVGMVRGYRCFARGAGEVYLGVLEKKH